MGRQAGKLRNSRVRNYHEPIAMLTYGFDISDRTKLSATASVRFGKNGYSALSWMNGDDPRPDYYRYLPSYWLNGMYEGDAPADGVIPDGFDQDTRYNEFHKSYFQWVNDPDKGMIDYDGLTQKNYMRAAEGKSANAYIEERHTDQIDFNFAAQIAHSFRNQSTLRGGIATRVNRTEYYDEVKDLLGGEYLLDIDKFAERDKAENEFNYQNDLLAYLENGRTAPPCRRGRQVQLRLLRFPAPGPDLGHVQRRFRRFFDERRRRGRLLEHVAPGSSHEGSVPLQLAG